MIEILNQAVPLHQRSEPWFQPVATDPGVVAQRRAMLMQSLRGITEAVYADERVYMDGTIDASHPDLPPWMRHALGILSCKPIDAVRTLGATPQLAETYYLLSPVTAYGFQVLMASLPQGRVSIDDTAIRGMLEGLGRRVMHTCIGVGNVEVTAHFEAAKLTGNIHNFKLDVDETTYQDLYERYPGLPYVLGTTVDQWLACCIELITRLQHDHDRIAVELLNGAPLGTLRHVTMDTGDLHEGGRSVAILRFDGDLRIVYKPKDLRIVRRVQDLFASINAVLAQPLLHVREVVLGQGYAWESFVAFHGCTTREEVEWFYRRYGAMTRMYELLEARDLWLDNVIAHGAWPVVIDLEMVLQPWMAPMLATRPSEFRAHLVIADTCFPTGLISMTFPIAPGQSPEDMGGLTPHRPFRTPFRTPEVMQTSTSGNQTVMLNNDLYTPTLDGVPVDVREWHPFVVEGYRTMAEAVANQLLPIVQSWAQSLSPTLPVRAIIRDTWTYQQALYASCSASNLRSVYHREAYLLRFPASMQGVQGFVHAQQRVGFSELAQLRQMDIPYYVSYVGDGELRQGGGASLGPCYHGSALERLATRCTATDDVAFRCDVFAATLAAGHGGAAADTRIYVDAAIDRAQAIDSIIDDLCSWAIRDGDDYTWISFLYHPAVQGVVFDSLRPTMQGSLHLALALRKAQLIIGRTDITPIINAIVTQAVNLEQRMSKEIEEGTAQAWYHDSEIGIASVRQGIARIRSYDHIATPAYTMCRDIGGSVLQSTTLVPPRLWLLGAGGVCALLESLADSVQA